MNMFIPELGTKLELTRNFSVSLLLEDRNNTLINFLFPKEFKSYEFYQKNFQNIRYKWLEKCKYPTYTEYTYSKDTEEEAYKKYEKQKNILREKLKEFIILKKGTVLEVDRIYIRQGAAKYSSVTFKWRLNNKVLRFWLKLVDVNLIQCKVVGQPEENRLLEIARCPVGG